MTNASYTTSDKKQDRQYKDFCDVIECSSEAIEKFEFKIDESNVIILHLCKKCMSIFSKGDMN